MSIIDWLKKLEDGDRTVPATTGGGSGSAGDTLRDAVIEALRTVYDPEIPVNIYDLGLIYGLVVDPDDGSVDISMTLTAPGCPVAASFPATVERVVGAVPGVGKAHVELVWDPPWTRERMSEAARLQLGML